MAFTRFVTAATSGGEIVLYGTGEQIRDFTYVTDVVQANVLAAVQAGVTQLDASVGGLGGCPFAPGASGNIATEETVYLLEESGVSTGLDLDAVLLAAAVTEQAVGHGLPSSLYRAGGRSTPQPRPVGGP